MLISLNRGKDGDRMSNDKNLTELGKNLMALRKSRNMTRRELAEKIGITEGALKSYELDGREPRLEVLIKVADFFGTSVDNLIRPKSFLSIPISVKSDNRGIMEGDLVSYIDIFTKKNVAGLINCLATTLTANISVFKGDNSKDIFQPDELTEINLSCMSDDTRFNISLNVKVEKNPSQPPLIKSFEEFVNQ